MNKKSTSKQVNESSIPEWRMIAEAAHVHIDSEFDRLERMFFGRVKDIRDFGARPNGTDCTSSIQKSIKFAQWGFSGATVMVTEGSWKIGQELVISGDVTVSGAPSGIINH